MNACTSDACQQGKKPCPFPSACEVEEDSPLYTIDDIGPWIATGAVVAICVVALFVWAYFTNLEPILRYAMGS